MSKEHSVSKTIWRALPLEAFNAEVLAYLNEIYKGVFTAQAIQHHYETYVGLDHSKAQLAVVSQITGLGKGNFLLDLGSGFGSFVLVAREVGIDATGVEIADFDLEFARNRLAHELPKDDPSRVFLNLDALETKLPSGHFDVITAWNVMEHVPDYRKLISEVYRLLKPGGWFIGVAPNYFAFRKEAHYRVFWLPMLPKKIGQSYLKLLGRDPSFLQNNIFYLTNLGVLTSLKKEGFSVINPQKQRLLHPELIQSPGKRRMFDLLSRLHLVWAVRLAQSIDFYNPFKAGIFFAAKK